MFIIDFDDTIFNTHDFKKVRASVLSDVGVSEKEYQETYMEAQRDGEFSVYSNERHAHLLELRGHSYEKVLSAFEKTTGAQLQMFLFPDTVEFVQNLKKLGHPLILLSLGEPSFQELKVRGSGVHEFFDRTFMVKDNKEHIIEELIGVGEKEEELWFINDKVGETMQMRVRFPKMSIVLKQSDSIDEEEYLQSALPYFKTLTEIYDYIKQKNG